MNLETTTIKREVHSASSFQNANSLTVQLNSVKVCQQRDQLQILRSHQDRADHMMLTYTNMILRTICMKSPALILELKLVEVGRLHKARKHVLLRLLLLCLERIGRAHLNTLYT